MRRAVAALLLAAAATCAVPARADYELWTWSEGRAPVAEHVAARVFTDARFNQRSKGLHQLFLRVGPLVEVAPWLLLGLQGTAYADRQPSGAFQQELRAELEPTLLFRAGDFAFADRNRLEFRWREPGTRGRYRNQLRVSFAPKGARFVPFVWEEALIDLAGDGFHQNRAAVGLGFQLDARVRVEASFLVRSRHEPAGWEHDRGFVFYLLVDATKP